MQTLCSCEEGIEIGKMMENKKSPCSVDHSGFTSLASKRHKADLSISSKLYERNILYQDSGTDEALNLDRKEKFGERILNLQQLVSPYGKTDTASVLLEAKEYIRFLHDQVKVLSAPYLQPTPANNMQDVGCYSLRSRGLCLVPISCTAGVASSNGADIWAPIKTATSPKLEKAMSQFN